MDRDTYLARLRPLLPEIGDRAVACEQLRRVPADTFKSFQQLGRVLAERRADGARVFRMDDRSPYSSYRCS